MLEAKTASESLPQAMPGMLLWNSHPRVYLAIEATGWAKCSYCGAEYTLNRSAQGTADIKAETDEVC